MERENVGRDVGPTSNFVPVKAGSTAIGECRPPRDWLLASAGLGHR